MSYQDDMRAVFEMSMLQLLPTYCGLTLFQSWKIAEEVFEELCFAVLGLGDLSVMWEHKASPIELFRESNLQSGGLMIRVKHPVAAIRLAELAALFADRPVVFACVRAPANLAHDVQKRLFNYVVLLKTRNRNTPRYDTGL